MKGSAKGNNVVMSGSFPDQLEDLRATLLRLKATEAEGFEGLIAATLTEITGVPFRLAGGGRQFGVDAEPAYESDSIYFEAKRYDGPISREKVLSKIPELSISNHGNIELWVLFATIPIPSQFAGTVRKACQQIGISTLILDWSVPVIPPLAVTLAMSETQAAAFLSRHVDERELAAKAATALKAIRNSNVFEKHAERIRLALKEPTLGIGMAKRANVEWLTSVFSNRQKARVFLQQPLAPQDRSAGTPLARDTLVNCMRPFLTCKPDDRIVAVLGAEGNGKSWLVAQSWLCLEAKPVMIVLTPDDFHQASPTGDLERILIDKLGQQTGDSLSERVVDKWHRKLERWRNHNVVNEPRLVVFVDGLNQRPEVHWWRYMDALALELCEVGGQLIVTVRTRYFRDRIKQRLISQVEEIEVPEWTEPERDEVLAAHGIEGADLHPNVGASLKNPRMLRIALELLRKERIKDLDELTVSRLLFEHMRVSEREAPYRPSADEFARELQDHADEMLSRVNAKQRDDLKVFDGGLEAVADGRFFVPLEDDPTRYTIEEDGLTLALGLSVLDRLRFARRNERDLDETLSALVEPINELDHTARVLIAALTVACLYEDQHVEIGAAVVRALAGVQNPEAEDRPAFEGLARKRPEVFIRAARNLCLAGAHQPNFDWIDAALHKAKSDDHAWRVISDELKSWLTCYSLSHGQGMDMFSRPSPDPAEQIEEEHASKQDQTDERLCSLSPAEEGLLKSLNRVDDGDPHMLAHFAFTLMAGKPIAPSAASLARWSFTVALNYDHLAYKGFMNLVRFNRVDWPAAREAILRECHIFEGADVSPTGKWALWCMLHATGHAEEARRANTLIAELTAGQTLPEGWRLIEDYCATDPCDPYSERPENIADTARKYEAIDATKIRLDMASSMEDRFFSMACPGMARFEPEVGVRTHRGFIADVLRREGFALRQGLIELRRHNALLTRDDALQLVKPTDGGAADALSKGDRWVVSLYRKLLAFPHLMAQEQIETLLGQHPNDDLVLNLMDVVKPLDGEMFASLLEKACRDNDECVQHLILAFGGTTDTAISEGVRRHLAALIGSGSARTRAEALRLIARLGDDRLIAAVAKGNWSATKLGTDGYGVYEAWWGSAVILEAAARGMIPHDEALDRIAPQLYGRAAKKLDTDALQEMARRIGASIGRAGNLAIEELAIPDIEIAAQANDGIGPTPYRVTERSPNSRYPIDLEALKRSSESDEEYLERQRGRQKRIREAYKAFKAELTQAKAHIILDELDIEGFDAIAASDQSLAASWYEMFMDLPKTSLMAMHNLGLLLAHALAAWDPDRAARLFTVLASSHPLVRITYGRVGIPLDGMTIWSAADSPRLDSLRFERLDSAGNDHELALEVLAALWSGKEELLRAYIGKRLETGEPAPISRALMVAGLSVDNAFGTKVLACYQDVPGFIGQAHKAAMYAYERNIWAEHWFRQMCETEEPEDFWRYSILFTKIVDGRFEVWQTADQECGEPFQMFRPSVESKLEHRFKRWRSHRERKLFGGDVPSSVFLA